MNLFVVSFCSRPKARFVFFFFFSFLHAFFVGMHEMQLESGPTKFSIFVLTVCSMSPSLSVSLQPTLERCVHCNEFFSKTRLVSHERFCQTNPPKQKVILSLFIHLGRLLFCSYLAILCYVYVFIQQIFSMHMWSCLSGLEAVGVCVHAMRSVI